MAKEKKTGSRNPELIRGVGKFSRSAMYHKRGLWAIKAKNGGKFPAHAKPATTDDAKKAREPRVYPAEDVPKPVARRVIRHPTKLRSSITPGTVLILLVGQFKGKRVVFLKQLSSGLLLVTGPFKINGVPLRRVNQCYAIATSTKVDVSSVDVSKYDDPYFAQAEKKETKGESEFFDTAAEDKKKEVPEEKKEDQKAIDAALMPVIEAVPQLKEYLRARFSLKSGQKPHTMKF